MTPPFRPFVVIDKRPRKIPLNLYTIIHGPAHLRDVLTKVADRFLPALSSNSVLRDDARLMVAAVDIYEHMVESGGCDFPTQLRVARITLAARAEQKTDGTCLLRVVVINPIRSQVSATMSSWSRF